jgi:hypothetical protein
MIYGHFLNYGSVIPLASINLNHGPECSGTVGAGMERNAQTI